MPSGFRIRAPGRGGPIRKPSEVATNPPLPIKHIPSIGKSGFPAALIVVLVSVAITFVPSEQPNVPVIRITILFMYFMEKKTLPPLSYVMSVLRSGRLW